MKVLSTGLAAYDIFLRVSEFPLENSKNRLSESVECGGGPAATAACTLAKYGIEVSFAGIVGNDLYGMKIKEEFEKFGVDTKFLQISSNCKTPVSHIIVNKQNGSRTTLTVKDKQNMELVDIDFYPDYIIIDGQEEEFSKKVIKDFPNAKVIIDAGSYREPIISLSYLADYIVCSFDFLSGFSDKPITSKEELINTYLKVVNIYKKTIIVTLGEYGSLYYDDSIKLVKSIKQNVVDTTGAGDIFHGAFIYGLINNMPMHEILKFSNVAGALSVDTIGGRDSIKSLKEVLEVYGQYR